MALRIRDAVQPDDFESWCLRVTGRGSLFSGLSTSVPEPSTPVGTVSIPLRLLDHCFCHCFGLTLVFYKPLKMTGILSYQVFSIETTEVLFLSLVKPSSPFLKFSWASTLACLLILLSPLPSVLWCKVTKLRGDTTERSRTFC